MGSSKQVVIMLVLLCMPLMGRAQSHHSTIEGIEFYVGTYTNKDSKGIYRYSLLNNGRIVSLGLAAKTSNPSFLAKSANSKYLLAVNELGSEQGGGTISSFAIKNDSLLPIDVKFSGGDFPCFITSNSYGHVLTANYGNGKIGLHKLNEDGRFSALLDVKAHYGKGTTPRQDSPHAHSIWFEENLRIISIDLGTNELWFSKIDSASNKLVETDPKKLSMAKGAGPRHMAIHPKGNWAYVINELSSTVSFIKKDKNGHFKLVTSFSTLPEGYDGKNTCADIHISSDGNFVYASNRGHDSIAIFEVNPKNGDLSKIGHEATRGKVPRNFALSPNQDYLLVANQQSNSLVSFKRDKVNGTLSFVDQIEAPTPVCILF